MEYIANKGQIANVPHYSTLGIHPVTAGRCAEKGKELVVNDDGIWDILKKRS